MNLLIDSVGKQYRGNVWGLQNISLQLRPGVLGLLGPNGAGKSTLMRILATVTRPTRGCVLWNDADALSSPDPLRMVLGYLPQDFGIYPQLSAFEFLEYLAAVKGLEPFSARRRVDELLSVVNLTDVRDRPLGGFSGGMRQRVGIAQALLNDPQLFWHSRSATPNASTSFLRASSHLSSTACRLARGSAPRHSHRQQIRSAPAGRRQLARPVCLADRLALYPHIGTCTRCLERFSQALRDPLYPVVVSRPHAHPPRPRLRGLCPGHTLNALPALLPRPHRGLRRSRSTRPQTPTPRLNLHVLPN